MSELLARVLDDLCWLHTDTTGVWSSDLGNSSRRAVYSAASSCLQPPADVPDNPGLSASFSPTPDVDNQQDWHVSPQMRQQSVVFKNISQISVKMGTILGHCTCWLTDIQVLHVGTKWDLSYLILSGVWVRILNDGFASQPCRWSLKQNLF